MDAIRSLAQYMARPSPRLQNYWGPSTIRAPPPAKFFTSTRFLGRHVSKIGINTFQLDSCEPDGLEESDRIRELVSGSALANPHS